MNKFIKMPGTDDLVNLNHIVSICKLDDNDYLVLLTSATITLNYDEYHKLYDIIRDIGIHRSNRSIY